MNQLTVTLSSTTLQQLLSIGQGLGHASISETIEHLAKETTLSNEKSREKLQLTIDIEKCAREFITCVADSYTDFPKLCSGESFKFGELYQIIDKVLPATSILPLYESLNKLERIKLGKAFKALVQESLAVGNIVIARASKKTNNSLTYRIYSGSRIVGTTILDTRSLENIDAEL